MHEPLDERYLVWLYGLVADPELEDPSQTYWKLLKQLYTKEFVWIIPNDDNRMEDGKDLRVEFIREEGLVLVDPDWLNLGCSVLELVIGLSRRLAFDLDGEPAYWFWQLIDNLGLGRYNDKSRLMRKRIDAILDNLIFRQYRYNGDGGFFPLKYAKEDQRRVELWYQLCAYVLELMDERENRGG